MKFAWLDILGKNIKVITTSILHWLYGIRKLNYGDIIKNLVVALLIIGVVFIALNLELLKSMPLLVLYGFIATLLTFLIIQFFTELHTNNKKKEEKEEIKVLQALEELSPTIDEAMIKCLYKLNASRIMLYCYHNSQKSLCNAPFAKMSVVKEVVDEDNNVEMMADYFQQQMLGLYRFPSYVNSHSIFTGNQEDVKQIDYKYYGNMVVTKDVYCAAKSIRNGSTNVGYVAIGRQEGKEIPAFDKIKTEIDKLAIECRAYIVINR